MEKLFTYIATGAAGAAGGYVIGNKSRQDSVVSTDNSFYLQQLQLANSKVDLLVTQISVQEKIIDQLKKGTTGSTDLIASLEQEVAKLKDQVDKSVTLSFAKYPFCIGTGDPTAMGYVVSRHGPLVSRLWQNMVWDGSAQVGLSAWGWNDTLTDLGVSSPIRSGNKRNVTIGSDANNYIKIIFSKGLCSSFAAILTFEEEVASDTNFTVASHMRGGYGVRIICVPLGSNSLMLVPLGPVSAPQGWTFAAWFMSAFNDYYTNKVYTGEVPIADRYSWMSGSYQSILLGHKNAKNLTLKGMSVISNPLLEQVLTYRDPIAYTSATNVPFQIYGHMVAATRLNTGSVPRFLKPNADGSYSDAGVTTSSYL